MHICRYLMIVLFAAWIGIGSSIGFADPLSKRQLRTVISDARMARRNFTRALRRHHQGKKLRRYVVMNDQGGARVYRKLSRTDPLFKLLAIPAKIFGDTLEHARFRKTFDHSRDIGGNSVHVYLESGRKPLTTVSPQGDRNAPRVERRYCGDAWSGTTVWYKNRVLVYQPGKSRPERGRRLGSDTYSYAVRPEDQIR